MRTATKLLLAGAGVLAAAGAAMAASDRAHVMNVVMPDGSIAHIRYAGDVASKVVVAPAEQAIPVAFAAEDPFALFDRVAFAMDREMDAMMRQVHALAAASTAPGGAPLSQAALQNLPAGTVSYSFTSFSGGNGASCSQSVQVTSLGANQPPKVVRQTQGDCTAMNSLAPVPAVQQAKPAAPAPRPVALEQVKTSAVKGPVV